jgi:hypothetical protein
MSVVEFSKYQTTILKAVDKLETSGYFKKQSPEDEDLLVNSAFVMIPVQTTIGGGINIGSAFPNIAVIGAQTGRIWYFALQQLCPEAYAEAFG